MWKLKRRKKLETAKIIVVSDFERQFCTGGLSRYCDFEDLGDLKDFELLFFLSVLLTIREILERLERDSGDASWSPDQSDQSALICTLYAVLKALNERMT